MSATAIKTLLTLNILWTIAAYAGPTGTLVGRVTDRVTHEPLVAANVFVEGTSLGNISDPNGEFTILFVPAGVQRVRASYVGYVTVVDSTVRVDDGRTTTVNFELQPQAVETAPVIITAQASGQDRAINEKLSAPQIMDVVSSARIQELPDANAAESAGRLPGVSLLRSGGEGVQVVIRGLQPKYNAISINGVRIASSNASDRSTDLSAISPYSLAGIEVTKVMTADQDPDALGGSVNFKMREAGAEEPGMRYNLLAQGGYTGLSNADNKYRNYKLVGSIEGRFLEDHQLGLFAQGDIERRNLSSNEYGGTFGSLNDSHIDYVTTGLNLNDVLRDRQRENGTVVVDYKGEGWKVDLSNFLSTGVTETQNRGEFFNILSSPIHNYSFNYTKSTLNLITNALELEYNFPFLHADANLSHTYAETKDPADWTIGFRQPDQNLNGFYNKSNIDPKSIPPLASDDPNQTFFSNLLLNNSFSRERALTAVLDLDMHLNLPDLNTTALIKFGGKYRHQTRSNAQQQSGGDGVALTSAGFIDSLIASHFPESAQYAGTTNIPITPFLDPGFSYGEFLGGDYRMVLPTSFSMLSEMASFVRANADLIQQRDAIAWAFDQFNSSTFNYSGYENQGAAYAMATVDVGSTLTLIPGIRFQNIKTSYTAPQGIQNTTSLHGGPYRHYDTTVTVEHSYWLPDIIVKYKPLSWFDLRLGYTNTLAYPDYNIVVPRIDVSLSNAIVWNNAQLAPTKSQNYDVYASFYDNNIGLLTIGGFWKKIDGLIYPLNFHVSGDSSLHYYPLSYVAGSQPANADYTIATAENLPDIIDNYGIELSWQTHFWYLPGILNGLVFNINYTHVFSSATYPAVIFIVPPGYRTKVPVDTTFNAPLLYQPDKILNLSLGYDYLGFSIRVSMIYQSDIFTGPSVEPVYTQLHTSTAAYQRWDLSVKQELPWLGLQIFGDINNLNSRDDISVIHASTGVPSSQQSYGLNGDLGLRWQR